jgi:DNA-binding transcriptional regulator/RsmH inhibitor MraZ
MAPFAPSLVTGVLVLIGKGYYFEVWAERGFNKAVKEYEASLGKTDQHPNAEGSEKDLQPRPEGGGTL